MNQGELDVVKQEMASMNTDILGISELKWTRADELNSDDCSIYYCGQESLRRNDVARMVNKRVQNVVFGYVYMMDHISIGLLSRVRLFATARTVAHQAPLSKEFSRQEYWSGLPFPSPGDLPNPGTESRASALQADSLLTESPKCSTWMQSQKQQNDLDSLPRQTFHITVIQVYAPTTNAEEAEAEFFYEDLQDL